MDEIYRIVARAKEINPECDWVTDMYLMKLVWVSERLLSITGYTQEDLLNKMVLDFVRSDKTLIQLKTEFMERMAKGIGTQIYCIKGKLKDFLIEFEFNFFNFEGGKYTSVKILSVDGNKLTS